MDRQHNGQKKRTKGQTMIYKTLHRNLNSSNANTHKNRGELRCSGRVGSSCSTSGTRGVPLVANPVSVGDIQLIYMHLKHCECTINIC